MQCKRFSKAFELFSTCIDSYSEEPNIWLRMGEAKLEIYHESLSENENQVENNNIEHF